MDLTKAWTEYTYVAFDLETSGAYPLGSDIVEFGGVKWKDGKEVEELQMLIKPREPMSDFIIKIHGITNEMVQEAPPISEKITEIRYFFDNCILMAHHAPFDVGFVAVDFERYQLPFPLAPVICTSLLARKLVPESPNHKLQTLIKVLNLAGGQAHRGLDDARACLQLGLLCMNRMGTQATLADVFAKVEKEILWENFSVLKNSDAKLQMIAQALQSKGDLAIKYQGGSIKETRRITPLGIVRNPDGDYVQATCHIDRISKRFYLDKISDIQRVF